MENKFRNNPFGHKFEFKNQEIKLFITRLDEKNRTFEFTIEKAIDGVLTPTGEPKLYFKNKFGEKTTNFDKKWNFIKHAYETNEIISLPYKIVINNNRKFLNLIFLNKDFE